MKETVCRADEIEPGGFKGAQVGPVRVVVVRDYQGQLHALAANCVHQGGPLDRGATYEYTKPGRDVGEYQPDYSQCVLKCPWHGFEYDVRTGEVLADPTRALQKFRVDEVDGQVVVELSAETVASA